MWVLVIAAFKELVSSNDHDYLCADVIIDFGSDGYNFCPSQVSWFSFIWIGVRDPVI